MTIKYLSKKIVPHYGQSDVEIDYSFSYDKETYIITCRLMGLDDGHPYLQPVSAILPEITTENTLTEQAILWKFEEECL